MPGAIPAGQTILPVSAQATRPKKRGQYHHGDLRNALIDAAVDLVAEKGVKGFSLTEASRRIGVAPSAPYRHFADRDALLVAVAMRGAEALVTRLRRTKRHAEPIARLDALVAAYIAFADKQRALFEALLSAAEEKENYPELEQIVEPIGAAFIEPALALCGGDERHANDLTLAIVAIAHGHATLLGERAFENARVATSRAQMTMHAVVSGRNELRR